MSQSLGPEACGIPAPRPGFKPASPPHWKAKSQPLDCQGSSDSRDILNYSQLSGVMLPML